MSVNKQQRLCKTNEFQALYQFGFKFYDNGLIFYCKPSSKMYHRIGIVASRKVGSAVIRNKFKRRMRELLPSFLEKVQIPHDCIVIATHPEIVTASFPKLQENLTLLFKKFSHLKYESAV